MATIDVKMVYNLLKLLEDNRIDVFANTQYCDPTGELERRYDRANEMLDDCIETVIDFFVRMGFNLEGGE